MSEELATTITDMREEDDVLKLTSQLLDGAAEPVVVGGFIMTTGVGELGGCKPELIKAWVDATREFGTY